ncbi:class I peptide chain release factor [Candidatus Moduliflexus flocculans]|uniref:Class I peptide chain release factor n=1 Tax=Candidatus Moduliflexus flocculans TaxID=1499966 RepID=A0A0S6VWB9_9BACT|nr:class I peptide chain release factor [Candidatus Moduliflexus flocculans]
MIPITDTISLDEQHLEEVFIHASGPGGQNVNKVATAVQLRFDVFHAELPDDVRERFCRLAGKRLSSDGIVIIEAKRFRAQEQNREDARNRLIALLQKAAQPPTPRRKTRPSLAAKQARLDGKRHRSNVKRLRRPTNQTEE